MEEQNNKPRITFAHNLAKKLLTDIGVENPPILIRDIINHIKREIDLSVYPWACSNNIDGIQITQGDSVAIGYNKSQHQHRQRFTIAHEIGHLLLGHTSGNFILDLNSKKPEETEANQFAAELLMPLAMLRTNFKNGQKNAKEIAKLYNVSEEAVWWRFMDCKLIGKL